MEASGDLTLAATVIRFPPRKRRLFVRALGEHTLSAHVWINETGAGVVGHKQASLFLELLYDPQ